MKKLYEKSEITFAIIWIVAYVVLFSIADSISNDIGVQKIVTVPLCVVLTAILCYFIKKNDLLEKYGLCKFKGSYKKYLFFIPLIILASVNLWNGVTLNLSILETILYVESMLFVGFLEEVIFRGLLFKAMCKDNVKAAIIVSSVTFGIGHIVNLLNGEDFLPTLLQVFYAIAAGFVFTLVFYYGKSLLPCILCHSILNSLSAFGVEADQNFRIFTAILLCVISIAYSLWIVWIEKKSKDNS